MPFVRPVLVLTLGLAALCAAPARADVLEIGDDGTVTRHVGPETFLGKDVRIIDASKHPAAVFLARAPRADVLAALRSAAFAHGLSPALLEEVARHESAFNPAAQSRKGALGVMQLMPQTAKALGVDPLKIEDNINGGAAYLAALLRYFGGDVQKALAGYNAGPQAVLKYNGVPPYAETRAYVAAILSALSARPDAYASLSASSVSSGVSGTGLRSR